MSFIAYIRGIPHIPSVTHVNVRSGPGTQNAKVIEIPVGTANLPILNVQPDSAGNQLNGKQYQWFQLQLSGSQTGWIRDDLIEISGNGTAFGYGNYPNRVFAFAVTRQQVAPQPTVPSSAASEVVSGTPATAQPAQPATTTTTTTTGFVPAQKDNATQQSFLQPTGTTAVQPAAPVAQPVAPQPAAAPAATAMSGSPTVVCMSKRGGALRSGPGSNNGKLGVMPYKETAPLLQVADAQDNIPIFKWYKVHYQGQEAWIREDLVRPAGDVSKVGLPNDLYPSPAPDSWWVRDFDENGMYIAKHAGWDHGGNVGAPLIAGPKGGVVTRVEFCQLCGPQGLSVVDKGIQIGTPQVFTPGWNYGYGHFIVVRYDNNLLPASTQQLLASKGLSGAHMFVMYAHLSKMLVKVGDQVGPGQQIADLGNSGQSTGPHLHLEVRAGANPNAPWPSIKSNLMTPGVLFYR